MGKAPSPCGTPAAYRRHLRHKESPCAACRRAKRGEAQQQRDEARKTEVATIIPTRPPLGAAVPSAPAPPGPVSSEKGDLEMARDSLVEAIDLVRAEDPTRLPGLVRELRETWKALRDLKAKGADEEAVDEFAKARAAREARKAAGG